MKYVQDFENFIFESQFNDSKILQVNSSIQSNLDPFDSIAGGECHDIALTVFTYVKNSGFLKEPVIKWTGAHAWVEGKFNQKNVILDIVANNQKYLGEPFKETEFNTNYPKNAQTSDDIEEYLQKNQRCNIDVEMAEAGAEELEFLNSFI
jgi:hypothetical protein